MKVKHEPLKTHPVPALRVVVHNGKVNEKPKKNKAEAEPAERKKHDERRERVQNKNIPEFYQHIIKPREYDFF